MMESEYQKQIKELDEYIKKSIEESHEKSLDFLRKVGIGMMKN